MAAIPTLYCAGPSCDHGAIYLIPYGKDCLLACELCFDMYARSFPGSVDKAKRIDPQGDLPDEYAPVRYHKRLLHNGNFFTVFVTIGGTGK